MDNIILRHGDVRFDKKQRFSGSGMAKRQPPNVSLSCGNRETDGMGIVRFVACSRPFCSFLRLFHLLKTAFWSAKGRLLDAKRPSTRVVKTAFSQRKGRLSAVLEPQTLHITATKRRNILNILKLRLHTSTGRIQARGLFILEYRRCGTPREIILQAFLRIYDDYVISGGVAPPRKRHSGINGKAVEKCFSERLQSCQLFLTLNLYYFRFFSLHLQPFMSLFQGRNGMSISF